jgi:glycosylphosphatidylinositol transamidase (GPIT) subunit GPI8
MFCRPCRVAGAAVGVALLVMSTCGAPRAAAAAPMSPNLLVNPGAELGDPSLSGYSGVTIPAGR